MGPEKRIQIRAVSLMVLTRHLAKCSTWLNKLMKKYIVPVLLMS